MSAPPAVVLGFGALAVGGLMWVAAASVGLPARAPSPRDGGEAQPEVRPVSSSVGVIDPLRDAPTFLGDGAPAAPAPVAVEAAAPSAAPTAAPARARGAARPRGASRTGASDGSCEAAVATISALRAPFPQGQHRPGAEADGVFARAAALAAPCPDLVIEVRGYADDHRDPVKNLDLAERRSLEAAARLERHGARGAQLVRSASGDAHPTAAWRGVLLRAGLRGAR